MTRAEMINPKFYLGRVSTQWHVYPSKQPLVAVAHDARGFWAYSKHGFWYRSPCSYELQLEVSKQAAVAHVVQCIGCDPGHCGCNVF